MTGKEKRAFLLSLCLYYKGGDLEDNPYSDPENGWQPKDPEMNFKWAIYRGEWLGVYEAMDDPEIMSREACAMALKNGIVGYMYKASNRELWKPCMELEDAFPPLIEHVERHPILKPLIAEMKELRADGYL